MDWEIIDEYGKKKDTRIWKQVKLFYTHGKKPNK